MTSSRPGSMCGGAAGGSAFRFSGRYSRWPAFSATFTRLTSTPTGTVAASSVPPTTPVDAFTWGETADKPPTGKAVVAASGVGAGWLIIPVPHRDPACCGRLIICCCCVLIIIGCCGTMPIIIICWCCCCCCSICWEGSRTGCSSGPGGGGPRGQSSGAGGASASSSPAFSSSTWPGVYTPLSPHSASTLPTRSFWSCSGARAWAARARGGSRCRRQRRAKAGGPSPEAALKNTSLSRYTRCSSLVNPSATPARLAVPGASAATSATYARSQSAAAQAYGGRAATHSLPARTASLVPSSRRTTSSKPAWSAGVRAAR
mmetsp:Transcript_1601/g.2623  ORF Transcript_1601/g.2623 Transcript_1601/m.2623 type:complete len:317 (-) Transcript_1601:802-1752(-)